VYHLSVHIAQRMDTMLLHATQHTIQNVVPLPFTIENPRSLDKLFSIQFGVLIGITGDLKGKMLLSAHSEIFGAIGEVMYGMALEGEMLSSFSGELGNMIAGGFSAKVYEEGIRTDITSPTILNGNMTISGYTKAMHIPVSFETTGKLGVYLLIDSLEGN
jgi:chemotaxis protein CheX